MVEMDILLACVIVLFLTSLVVGTLQTVARDGHRQVPYDPGYDTRHGAGDR
jgi:hypothetical protein